MKIKGAIFDFDGTLFDSMFIWDNVGADYLRSVGKTPEEKAVLARLGWAPFRESSDLQLVPIRQLALFKQMQGVKDNKGLKEEEKTSKVSEIQAQLDDLDRLTAALGAMTSVNKAVQ